MIHNSTGDNNSTATSLAFKAAYNFFDPKPLEGNSLDQFYIEAFSERQVQELATTVQLSERYRKLLVIGHRGCGKSTILNKIKKNLGRDHEIVAFSATDVLNLDEVEPLDLLFLNP